MAELVSVRYVGPHTEGIVFEHQGRGYEVAHGDVVDLPASLADEFVGRGEFAVVEVAPLAADTTPPAKRRRAPSA